VIAKAIKGTGFRGTLEYVERGGPRIGGNMAGETPRELAAEFGQVRALRPNLKAAVLHLPIRPAPGESLTDEEWNAVAERVLVSLGYDDVPYVVYRHGEGSTEHVHIVASRVTYGGRVVSTSNDYYRAMEALRAIERDLGLRVVPFRDDRARRPRQAEHQLGRRAAEPSQRAALERLVREAAVGGPSVATFVERLERAGVEVLPNLATTGHVTGLSYRYGDFLTKGSALGRPFTWQGVLRHLGVTYDPARDLPALLAAQARVRGAGRGRSAGEAAALSPQSGPTSPESASPGQASVSDITLLQVRRHVRALGVSRFDVLALDARTGRQELRTGWTLEQLERALGWLRHQNARGAEILIRPCEPSVVVLAEVPETAFRSSRDRGLAPAAAVEVGQGSFELWFRHGGEVSLQEAAVLRPLLARALGVNPERSPSPWGHLAGFTSPLASSDASGPRYVRLRAHEGAGYARAEELVGMARRAVAEREIQREVAREVETFEELTRVHGAPQDLAHELRGSDTAALARPVPPSEVTAAAARSAFDGLRQADAAHVRALRELGLAGPVDFPARYEAALATARVAAAVRRDLEELSGLRPLPALDGRALERIVELRGRLLRTGERLAVSRGVERAAATLSHRAAGRELDRLTRQLGLAPPSADAIARSALSRRTEPLASAYREASRDIERIAARPAVPAAAEEVELLRDSLARRLAAELPLEAHREELGRAARALAAERSDLLVRLAPADGTAAEVPALLDCLERVERRLAVVEHAAGRAARDAIERALGRLEERLVLVPTTTVFRDYTELLSVRERLARQVGILEGQVRVRLDERAALPVLRPPRPADAAPDLPALRAEVGRAAAEVLRQPGPPAFAGYREAVARHLAGVERGHELAVWSEVHAARREVRQLLREASPNGRGFDRAVSARWHAAFDRLDAAQRALAERLPAPRHPVAIGGAETSRLGALARRLRLEDSPETLAILHREVATRLARSGGGLAARPSPLPAPRTLTDAVREFRAARAGLLRAGRAVARDPSAAHLERLGVALARYQVRGGHLRGLADRQVIVPRPALLRPADFLRHPRFAGATQRAATAWAAYAARRGLSEHTIATALAHLTHTRPLLTATRLVTVDNPALMATLAVFWAARVARRLVRDRVHSP
jgi:hypothetical protein